MRSRVVLALLSFRLSGTIPDFNPYGSLLAWLDLHNNQFTGTVSETVVPASSCHGGPVRKQPERHPECSYWVSKLKGLVASYKPCYSTWCLHVFIDLYVYANPPGTTHHGVGCCCQCCSDAPLLHMNSGHTMASLVGWQELTGRNVPQ